MRSGLASHPWQGPKIFVQKVAWFTKGQNRSLRRKFFLASSWTPGYDPTTVVMSTV